MYYVEEETVSNFLALPSSPLSPDFYGEPIKFINQEERPSKTLNYKPESHSLVILVLVYLLHGTYRN
jgi:hypothetical protein